MRELTVLYDAHCGVCRRARAWLEGQAQLLPLAFVAAGSAEAVERYPELGVADTLRELHVVGDHGEVYRGTSAWLMCFYALRDYRGWALTFAAPWGRPFFAAGVRLVAGLRTTRACSGECGMTHAPSAAAPARPARPGRSARGRGVASSLAVLLLLAPLTAVGLATAASVALLFAVAAAAAGS